ncbi:hypothetical protein D9758_005026 [Tetrapyrgos nigripes]|uniref:Dihydroxyacetone kinase n=1 Tax=Tetrapyrgos nigripes TaxID=182062 RepID=A0A8H5LWK2_9AGAR|nr:hypothetical protein D9758_005026 [Tetrapyrgos nigripes]
MSHKHIYNSSDGLVLKSLQGAVILNPSLRLHAPSKTVYVNPQSSNTQVSVISGGGAGHEPAHASYTGHGMLAASVSGDIFASPSSKQIAYALRLATFTGTDPNTPSKDVLAIINNYTGDRLNFGSAIEKAKADGLMVESVVVADDVSLLHSPGNEGAKVVGPRGLAGNILVCKILGALAERNATLGRVKEVGDTVVGSLASIGVGLEHCHVPGRDRNGSVLGETECELGLGLHNEPGAERKELGDAERLVNEMIDKILESRGSESDSSRFVEKDDKTVLFVNNLGGMSQLEMGAVLKDVSDCLEHRGICPRRVYLSSFMTSLNAPGFSIHLLNVSSIYRSLANGRGDLDILQLLDDPTDAHSWVGVRRFWPGSGQNRDYASEEKDTAHTLYLSHDEVHLSLNDAAERRFWGVADISSEAVKRGILRACRAVLEVEKDMTEFDTIVGDGDCGETFAMGAKAVISAIEKEIVVATMSPSILVQRIGGVLEENMGGTIGALFTIYFTAWSSALKNMMTMETLSKTPSEALRSMSHHTPAKLGDRTIIDALQPFCEALKEGKGITEASKKAKEGAEKTRGMKARLGRAVYVGSRPGKDSERELPPDPGAWGVAAIIEGFKTGFVGN